MSALAALRAPSLDEIEALAHDAFAALPDFFGPAARAWRSTSTISPTTPPSKR